MIGKIVDSDSKIARLGAANIYWTGRKFEPEFSSRVRFLQPDIEFLNKFLGENQKLLSIDQFKILPYFKLKGFEFGNWVSLNQRADRLIATCISLKHLSMIMKSRNLGFDSEVGIAFGARGRSGAIAHFEPGHGMINLTKEGGYYSLAHEYGHALDYILGTYIDRNKKNRFLSGGHLTSKKLRDNSGPLRDYMNEIVDNIKLSDSYARIEKEREYYHLRTEIFARFFEQYISYKLVKMKIQNHFLAKSPNSYKEKYYLTDKDLKKLIPVMDEFIKKIAPILNSKK